MRGTWENLTALREEGSSEAASGTFSITLFSLLISGSWRFLALHHHHLASLHLPPPSGPASPVWISPTPLLPFPEVTASFEYLSVPRPLPPRRVVLLQGSLR